MASARTSAQRSDLIKTARPWARRPARLDELCLAALTLAGRLQAATLADRPHALVLGTAVGCLESDYAFWSSLRAATPPRPRLFAYTLPNVALGEVAIRFGLSGDQLCLSSGRASALAALCDAADRIAAGEVEAALVLAIDPVGPGLQAMLERWPLPTQPDPMQAFGWRLEVTRPDLPPSTLQLDSWSTRFDPSPTTASSPAPSGMDPMGAMGVDDLVAGGHARARCPSGYTVELRLR